MSLKFRRDGAVFPTEVKDGNLIIHFNESSISIPFKFLKEDFDFDNRNFPMSNVMAYLENSEHILVMRFDGTVTIMNKDLTVVGFNKFDRKIIYDRMLYLPVGTVLVWGDNIRRLLNCYVYKAKETGTWILTCSEDPEPIVFIPEENPLFCEDIIKGIRIRPGLIKIGKNEYADDEGKYTVIGTPIRVTGHIEL